MSEDEVKILATILLGLGLVGPVFGEGATIEDEACALADSFAARLDAAGYRMVHK